MAKTQAQQLSTTFKEIEKSLSSPVGKIQANTSKRSAMKIAPNAAVTTAAAVVGIISGIAGMFSSSRNRQRQKEIIARLKQVQKKLELIDSKVDQVLYRLAQLGVKIDLIPLRMTRLELRALEKTYYELLPGWVSKTRGWRTDASEFRLDHQIVINKMTILGYAHYLLVVKSMVENIGLANLLGFSATAKKPIAEGFVDYIDECLDESRPGTIASKLPPLREQLEVLEQTADQLPKAGFLRSKSRSLPEGNGVYVWTTYFYEVIDGSISNGYKRTGEIISRFGGSTWYPNNPGDQPNSIDLGTSTVKLKGESISLEDRSGSIGLQAIRDRGPTTDVLLAQHEGVRVDYFRVQAIKMLVDADIDALQKAKKSILSLALK